MLKKLGINRNAGKWVDTYVFWQGAVVALMVVLACIYPLRKVMKLKEVEALRS